MPYHEAMTNREREWNAHLDAERSHDRIQRKGYQQRCEDGGDQRFLNQTWTTPGMHWTSLDPALGASNYAILVQNAIFRP